eukprot:TRINITY_DN83579_c0_g1_i2.p2 TRINITY_DN83579_c0_g1~~TRINITY_DN83579_c0_g1_i2.p2  ORF type:complete len:157 (-),score=25.72 TRINITY_DN83579_c0_g1_i2:74-544(-)
MRSVKHHLREKAEFTSTVRRGSAIGDGTLLKEGHFYGIRTLEIGTRNYIRHMVEALQERKAGKVARMVVRLGREKFQELFDEVVAVQRQGGVLTNDDRGRLRSPGGVLFTLLKLKMQLGQVSRQDYDYICEVQKTSTTGRKNTRLKRKQLPNNEAE